MKLNLGCGPRDFGSDWIHIDGGNYPHLHSHNIIELPFDNDSVDLIYASHVIEYFNRDDVTVVLKEWVRCLKPKGVLRLAVPNFEVMAKLYVDKKYPLEHFLGPLYGKITMAESFIYQKTVYDSDSLITVLESIGLQNIKTWDWKTMAHAKFDDHSQAYLPHMDKENGTLISLNMEGEK